ncbi:MAG: SH3 domain-containing protein [Lachnospiraceae bacterium]|nr:SH3 domain-containing protein [Lachnospiraceae bacterium]
MKRSGRTAACAMVLTLLAAICGGLVSCGRKPPESDGLVPIETAKSYEHVAKTESTQPPPPDGGGTTPVPGTPDGDPVGTVTPTAPLPTPGDVTAGEDIVYVAVSKLNLRAEPSLESEVIAQAKYGDAFVRTEKGSEGWDKLLYDGREVYAFAEFLSDQKVSGAGGGIAGQLAADVKKK